MHSRLWTVAAFAVIVSGCSTVMEADRPSAVNLGTYHAGLKRIEVIEKLGAPISTVKDEGRPCDIYKLYTHGTSTAAKVGIITGEAAADVFTLGLFEVIATPAQAASKAHNHTVLFCYSDDEHLISVIDQGRKLPSDWPAEQNARQVATPVTPISPTPISTAANQPSQQDTPAKSCRSGGLSVQGDSSALHKTC